MSKESGDADLRLTQLVDHVLEAMRVGDDIDAAVLSERFGLPQEELEDYLRGLQALNALGSEVQTLDDEDEIAIKPILPDDFILLDELGRGGMGIVYRARQRSLGREVAVKVLRPGELYFARAIARFRKEARALARLRHPNIVTIHEVGEVEGHVYFSMDLIRGESLKSLIESQKLTTTRTTKIMRQVASAIAYTHGQGLIHRDLKPLNVLLDVADKPYVTDFGLARQIDASPEITQTGQVIGTPHYMSPEQAQGEAAAIGEATDTWALGALLYECISGQPPFPGQSPVQVLHDVIHNHPARPTQLSKTCPPGLEAIALKALQKRPADRYATAQAFLEDLERFEQGRALRAKAETSFEGLLRFARIHSRSLLSAAGMAVVLGLIFSFTVLPRFGKDPATARAIGDAFWEKGDKSAAAEAYDRIEDLDEDDHELLKRVLGGSFVEAQELRREGKLSEARSLLLKTLERGQVLNTELDRRTRRRGPWDLLFDIHMELAFVVCELDGVEAAEAMTAALRESKGAFDSSWDPVMEALLPQLNGSSERLQAWARQRVSDGLFMQIEDLQDRGLEYRTEITLSLLLDPDVDPRRFDVIASKVLVTADGQLIDRLIAHLKNDSAPLNTRGMAARALERIFDLPPGSGSDRASPQVTREETNSYAALYRDLREATPLRAFQIRVDRLFQEDMISRPDFAATFRKLTTQDVTSLDRRQIEGWWADHRDDDPSQRWRAQLHLSEDVTIEGIWPKLETYFGLKSAWIHEFLIWLRGPDAIRVVPDPWNKLNSRWSKLFLRETIGRAGSCCEVAVFSIKNGLIETKAQSTPSVSLAWKKKQNKWTRDWQSVGVLPRNIVLERPPSPQFYFLGLAPIAWHQQSLPGLQISIEPSLDHQGRSEFISCGYVSIEDRSAHVVRQTSGPLLFRGVDQIFSLTSVRDDLDFGARNSAVAFSIIPRTPGASRTWNLRAWRQLLEDNLIALEVEERREPADRYFQYLKSDDALLHAAMVLGAPRALSSLRFMAEVAAKWDNGSEFRNRILIARLMSGDETLMEELRQKELRSVLGEFSATDPTRIWIHIALNSPVPAAQGFARQKLQALKPGKDTLHVLGGAWRSGLQLSDEVMEALDEAGELDGPNLAALKEKPFEVLLAILIWFTTCAALFRLTFRPLWRRRAAVMLVILGTVMAWVQLDFRGHGMVPGAIGWCLAALGAHVLGHLINLPKSKMMAWALTALALRAMFIEDFSLISYPMEYILILLGSLGAFVLVRQSEGRSLAEQGRNLLGSIPIGFLIIGLLGSYVLAYVGRASQIHESDSGPAEFIFWATWVITAMRTLRNRKASPNWVINGRYLWFYFLPILLLPSWVTLLSLAHNFDALSKLSNESWFPVYFTVISFGHAGILFWLTLQVFKAEGRANRELRRKQREKPPAPAMS